MEKRLESRNAALRVDALLKNPRMLTSQLENGNLESSVAIRAYFKLMERLAR
ncbi:MAG: hypothetical protein KAT58_06240 [candidate division Zixibacteria bacterium]|nr:hypothetical protein [candidate division Zixibacteria bacterium]